MSVAMIPLFIVTNSKRFRYLDKFGDVQIESSQWITRISMYAFLLGIMYIKVFALERGVMARMVEDYDEEKHSLVGWFANCFGLNL